MYPQRELIRLYVYKAALRRRISRHRAECVEAAARVALPLEWLDRALGFWRRLSPLAILAAVPFGALVTRAVFPRLKIIGSLMRWGPFVVGAVRGVAAAFRSRDPSGS